jgi:hypothetical protein
VIWNLMDFLCEGFGACYLLAVGVYDRVWWLLGRSLWHGIIWGLENWFPVSQAACGGGMLGSLTASALES